ncbi:Phage tail tape measure protein [uncultured Caudovirales phage]|uniref:Phage tail tape measure protein n=1 Tax=uncultured Caudovirales phage TaxID=2100421 RepID=A0A6J5RV24_9CAUD|nr:Phage tail tape measure protein [uncultured Caudovirales phage]
MAKDDLEIRMRTRGGARSKAEVDVVTRSVEKLGLAGTTAGQRISGAGKSLDKFQKRSQKTAQKVKQSSSAMATGISLPLAAVAVGSAALAIEFESSMDKITGLVGLPAAEVHHLGQEVLALAGEVPVAPKELADALYFLTSSGLNAKESMIALRASARGSAAGLGDTAKIADAVSSAMNAYGHSSMNAAKATDILAATAKAGKAEPEALAATMGRVLPIASELGVKFEDVGGAVAALTLTGSDASEATTALRQTLQKIIKPGAEGVKMLSKYGLSLKDVQGSIKQKGLLPTLEMLRKRFKGNTMDLGKLFQGVEGFNGVLALTGKHSKQAKDAMDMVAHSTGMTDKAFAAASKTVKFKMDQALSSVKAAGIEIGQSVLPTLVPVLETVARTVVGVAKAFQKLPGPIKTFIIILAGAAMVLPPLILMVSSLAVAVNAATWPVTLAIVAIVAITAAVIAAYVNFKWFRDIVAGVWAIMKITPLGLLIRGIIALVKSLGGLGGIFKKLKAIVMTVWQSFAAPALKVLIAILKFAASVIIGSFVVSWKILKFAVMVVWALITNSPIVLLIRWIVGLISKLGIFSAAWGLVKGAIHLVWEVMKASPIGYVVRHFKTLLKVGQSVAGKIGSAFGDAWGWIKTGFADAVNWILDALRPLVDAFNKLPGDDITLPGPLGATPTAAAPRDIGRAASRGGMARGGLVGRSGTYTVGERGREKVYLPRGAVVEPNGGFGGEVVVPVTLQVDGQVLAKTVRRHAVKKLATR